jgi:signal transduction histidine kinase
LPAPASLFLPAHAGVLVALFVTLRLIGPVTNPRWRGPVAVAAALAMFSNPLLAAVLTASQVPSLYAAIILVGTSGTYMVTRWAAVTTLSAATVWLMVIVPIAPRAQARDHVAAIVTAVAMGAVLHFFGRASLRRVVHLRARDAARQQALEQALAETEEARSALDHKVAERTVELAAARDAIAAELAERKTVEEQRHALERRLSDAQRMEAVGRLAGGVAHDFNNLLMVIGGNVELLIESDRIEAAEKADLHEIQDAVERSSRLIRQLLASGRRQVMQPRAVTLTELVGGTRGMIERVIGADIRLVVELAGADVSITADLGQLEQVLMNLVFNARDAMPRGGTLTLRSRVCRFEEDDELRPPAMSPGGYAVLEVIDTGVGMDEVVRRSAFEPFFTTKKAHSGSGLGLAAVAGIVAQHGGFVDVTSAPAAGSKFTIYLPCAAAVATVAPATPPVVPPLPTGHETVLVVDDEQLVRRLTVNGLARLGYRVLDACDGEAALRMMATTPGIDLVVTDVIMPGIDGAELAERVRSGWPATRILFMSGYVGDRLASRGLANNDALLLAKPFSLAELGTRVRGLLDRAV